MALEGSSQLTASVLESLEFKILVAVAFGALIGLEREWSEKGLGVRTFPLIAVIGAVMSFLGSGEVVVGGVFVIVVAFSLLIHGVLTEEEMHYTTAASILVTYLAGVLLGIGRFRAAAILSAVTAFLLVFKPELHSFVWGLNHQELRSAAILGVFTLIIYPLLPSQPINVGVSLDVRKIWLFVIAVTGIGLLNYAIAQKYGRKGMYLAGYLGGLANSLAVIGDVTARARSGDDELDGTLASVGILSVSAMLTRNAILVGIFAWSLLPLIFPVLGLMLLVSFGFALYYGRNDESFKPSVESPFNVSSALKLGALFLGIMILQRLALDYLGTGGLLLTAFLGGLVSSAGSVSSMILVFTSGKASGVEASVGVVLACIGSTLVKTVVATYGGRRGFWGKVAFASLVISLFGGAGIAVLVEIV
ncbi:MAG: MgtC/SapB family protein [Halobacteria archaeon]